MAIVSLTLFHSANAVLSQGAMRAFGGEFCVHCGSVALGTCPRRFVGLRSYNGPQTQQLMKEVILLRDNPNRNSNRKTKVNGQTPPFLVGRLRHEILSNAFSSYFSEYMSRHSLNICLEGL